MKLKQITRLFLVTNIFLIGFFLKSISQQCGGVTFISNPIVSKNLDNSILIKWTDQGEAANLQYFVIQRQTGSNLITNIGQVSKNGSATSNSYSFTDNYPCYASSSTGTLAYRIKWVTSDGTQCQSNYASITLSGCPTWSQSNCSGLTITGPGSICNSSVATYETSNSNVSNTNSSTISWSMSPAGIANISVSSYDKNVITATRNGTSSGILTLTTTGSSTCGTYTKQIAIGTPAPTGLQLAPVSCPEYYFVCNPPPQITTANWTAYNETTHIVTTLPGTTASSKTTFSSTGLYTVCVSAQNTCGTSATTCIGVNVTCSTGGAGGHSIEAPKTIAKKPGENEPIVSEFTEPTIYPNPAKGNLTIDLGAVNGASKLKGLKNISIYNSLGTRVAEFRYNNFSQVVHLNIANFSSGVYVVKLSDGTQTLSKKLIIEN